MTTLTVNGQQYTVNASAQMPLLWVLRDLIGLTGTKYGCGISQCGACTVLFNGKAARSCQIALSSAAGAEIVTIEGLSPDSTHPVQLAWIAEQVPQCGYCQSGMILATVSLLAETPQPTDHQINEGIKNLCVCGTFERIRAAIHRAAGN